MYVFTLTWEISVHFNMRNKEVYKGPFIFKNILFPLLEYSSLFAIPYTHL